MPIPQNRQSDPKPAGLCKELAQEWRTATWPKKMEAIIVLTLIAGLYLSTPVAILYGLINTTPSGGSSDPLFQVIHRTAYGTLVTLTAILIILPLAAVFTAVKYDRKLKQKASSPNRG